MSNNWKEFERGIARRFRRWFPDARRGLQYQESEHCPDVVGTPWYVECKTSGSNYVKYEGDNGTVAVKRGDMYSLYSHYYHRMMEWRDNDCGIDLPVIIVCSVPRWSNRILVFMHSNFWKSLCGAKPDDTQYIVEVTWTQFAAALDEIYPVKEKI